MYRGWESTISPLIGVVALRRPGDNERHRMRNASLLAVTSGVYITNGRGNGRSDSFADLFARRKARPYMHTL
ncbi:unnamed protein product, partial [Iphiclides podalirius]